MKQSAPATSAVVASRIMWNLPPVAVALNAAVAAVLPMLVAWKASLVVL